MQENKLYHETRKTIQLILENPETGIDEKVNLIYAFDLNEARKCTNAPCSAPMGKSKIRTILEDRGIM